LPAGSQKDLPQQLQINSCAICWPARCKYERSVHKDIHTHSKKLLHTARRTVAHFMAGWLPGWLTDWLAGLLPACLRIVRMPGLAGRPRPTKKKMKKPKKETPLGCKLGKYLFKNFTLKCICG